MQLRIVLFIGILITVFACNRDDDNSGQYIIDGEYTGIFEREGSTSKVVLSFDNGSFVGVSETEKFPAICKGNYSVLNDSVTFNNECPWTAEFDWSLILSAEWKYKMDGDTFILIKSNGDKYTLTRQ